MRWTVDWTPTAEASFLRIPSWHDAAMVAAAVYRLAETGEGTLYAMPHDPANTARLRVGRYRVRLTRDRPQRVLRVWYVYRA